MTKTRPEGQNIDNQRLRIGIGRISQEHNTAFYFEKSARSAGHDVTVIQHSDEQFQNTTFDLFLVIDPWFQGVCDLPLLDYPTAVVLIDVHQDLPTRLMFAKYFDHVFVAQRDYISAITALGHSSVHWLPLAGDIETHFAPGLVRDIEVGFIGKMGRPGTDRHEVLSNVLPRFKTNDIGQSYTPAEMGRIYSRSRIVFNKSINGDLNMRAFEALAAGALLITDRINNGLTDLFTEGVHYLGYDTAEEAVSQIEYYLANESARALIARNGQDLLRSRHTYDIRLAQILDVVQVAADARPAPARNARPAQLLDWRAQWAQQRGVAFADAAALVAEGLSPAAYGALAVGLVRHFRRRWHDWMHNRPQQPK